MLWRWVFAALWIGPGVAIVLWHERRFSIGAILAGFLLGGLCGPFVIFMDLERDLRRRGGSDDRERR